MIESIAFPRWLVVDPEKEEVAGGTHLLAEREIWIRWEIDSIR